ncbi:MauE/DoxX family redox-associated membrane protein [Terrimonas alba]|uniref:MauE/DoxX family redox-associated membrane protein n=1 Tax=Terrimonas alba TaxID=3349636 RepID=UPI0035F31167
MMKKRTFAIDIISAALLLLFLYTAISKLADQANFKDVLSHSPLIKFFAGVTAWGLPAIEILVALLLFLPATRKKGLYAALVLLVLLTLYLICMIIFAPSLPCNCGGVIQRLSWTQHIFFNLFFILLSVAGINLSRRRFKPESSAPT